MEVDSVAELDELLAGETRAEVELWASRDFVGASDPSEVEAARDQCRAMYSECVERISRAWGPPEFRGSLTVVDGELVVPDGYPWELCEFAEEVAIWQRDENWRACAWWEQQDPVMPFSVFVGVTESEE